MSNCIYCSKKIEGLTGFFRTRHPVCSERVEKSKNQILSIVENIAERESLDDLIKEVRQISKDGLVPDVEFNQVLINGWEKAVDKALADNVLSEREENNLMAFMKSASLGQTDLDTNGFYTRTIKNGIIRGVLEGKNPNRLRLDGQLPFNFKKDETLIWVFQDVKYFEQRTKRTYQGGYSGVSVRVMKGVYYRTGAFRGNPVDTTYSSHLDTGILGITDKHIYFSGLTKNFRIPYPKIVSFEPFSDGISLTQDKANAKPQIFLTDDGWYTYNLVTNLSKR